MNKFEENLKNLNIPDINDNKLKYELKEKLEEKYFNKNFRLAFRVSTAFAVFLALTVFTFVFYPQITSNINDTIVGNSNVIAQKRVISDYNANEIIPPTRDFSNLDQIAVNNHNVTETATDTTHFLQPEDIEEGKVYMVRKRKTDNNRSIILINEVKK